MSRLTLVSLSMGRDQREIADSIGEGGAGKLKALLTESLNDYLAPHRAKRAELEANPDYIRSVLRKGIDEARKFASATLDEVRDVMNMKI
ncbi:hypothetical protein [Sorangium sp. So ce1078]|uniref:hypothetical protein n=1 Tax=Sorangium sp. So ce1078 TaxID=3133329 RepID=UPI003F5D6153